MELRIAATWDGQPIPESDVAVIECFIENGELTVLVDARFFGDAPPPRPPGSTAKLWEHEVVELFLVGAGSRYLEIELAPHGHYLLLELKGRRNVVRQGMEIRYEAERFGERWRGVAIVPLALLPERITHANAFAIHGSGDRRRHLAAAPVPGPGPDFHRLQSFPAVEWPPGPRP
jgi:hypothetical protein